MEHPSASIQDQGVRLSATLILQCTSIYNSTSDGWLWQLSLLNIWDGVKGEGRVPTKDLLIRDHQRRVEACKKGLQEKGRLGSHQTTECRNVVCLLGDTSILSLALWCLLTICTKFRLKIFLLLMREEAPKHPPPLNPPPLTLSPLPSSSVLLSIVSWNCSYFFRS